MGTVNDLVASDTVVLAFQSYCFISKFPFFELHFSVLKQILGMLVKVCPSNNGREMPLESWPISPMQDKILFCSLRKGVQTHHSYRHPTYANSKVSI